MPLLFSYGSLQREDVQVSTFARRLKGEKAELRGFERSIVKITDPTRAAVHGSTHHANVIPTDRNDSAVDGTALEVTDDELANADRYEALDGYKRIPVVLASGRDAWVYVEG
jgi:Gamma-glutamyl cyclotransferase, AIG2-like